MHLKILFTKGTCSCMFGIFLMIWNEKKKWKSVEGVYILPSNIRVANVGSCDLGLGPE